MKGKEGSSTSYNASVNIRKKDPSGPLPLTGKERNENLSMASPNEEGEKKRRSLLRSLT